MHGILHRFVIYSGLGLFGTACHFVVLAITVGVLGFGPVEGSSLGALAGALTNYWLNYHFNYRSRKLHREALTRYLSVATAGFLLNALLMDILAVRIGLYYLLAQVITTGLVLLWTFSVNHFWTFRTR